MFLDRVGTINEREASVNHLQDVTREVLICSSFQTAALHTTENPNWDITDGEKNYSEEKPKIVTFSLFLENLQHCRYIFFLPSIHMPDTIATSQNI